MIERAIIDKNARIGRNVKVVNDRGTVDSEDNYTHVIRDGVVVIPKSAVVADGTVILVQLEATQAWARVGGLRQGLAQAKYPGRNGSCPCRAVASTWKSSTASASGLLQRSAPTGAGKTTTVEILEGLNTPTSGEVEVLGREWPHRGEAAIRERIGVTLQETRFPDKETVHEIVSLFRSFYKSGMNPDDVIGARLARK